MSLLTALAEVKMSILTTFNLGNGKKISEKIISENKRTTGMITSVKTCWWIKINTKPIRRHMLDGAKFPHIIHFTYTVDGAAYQGSSCVDWQLRCPDKGERVTVFYDKNDPARYAVSPSGVSL